MTSFVQNIFGAGTVRVLGAALLAAAALPAAADASYTVGGGDASGTVTFSRPIPQVGSPGACPATSFSIGGSSEAFTLNTVITGFAGAVTLKGAGGSSCETASGGSGTLTLTEVKGTGPTGSEINCADPAKGTTLSGGYTRLGTTVIAILGGSCTVNGGYPVPVSFDFSGQFVPTNNGGGVSAPISAALFAGEFTVAPV